MFKDLYRKVDAKVEPDLKLINDTKAKMLEELNHKKKVRYIHFYRYATVAACFILVVGLATVNVTKTANQSVQDIGSASSSIDSVSKGNLSFSSSSSFDSVLVNSGVPVNAFSSYFSVESASAQSTSSIGGSIIQFFLNILQWFKELLF